MKPLNKEGFNPIYVVSIIAIVGIIGFTGWYVWRANNRNSKTVSGPETTATVPTSSKNWKTYIGTELPIRFKYPRDWSVVASQDPNSTPESILTKLIITSTTGYSWEIVEWSHGKGYICMPKSTDVPFTAGNQCSSSRVLSAQKIGTSVYDAGGNERDVYLTEVEIGRDRPVNDGPDEYEVCLESSPKGVAFVTNVDTMPSAYALPRNIMPEPVSGLESDSTYNSKGKLIGDHLSLCASSPDPGFFDSNDGKIIKAILTSVRFE